MKRNLNLMLTVLALTTTFVSTPTNAQRYEKIGKVREIVVAHNPSSDAAENLAVVHVEGFNNAGSCYVSSVGMVAMRILNNAQGKSQLALLTAAQMTGQKVSVRVNDDDKDGDSYCFLQLMRMDPNY